MSKPPVQEVKLEIKLDDDVAQGVYSNMAVVNHSDAEFTIDFIFIQPQAPQAKVRSRIITSPRHVKRLIKALEENLRRYEQSFGTVTVEEKPQVTDGDYH